MTDVYQDFIGKLATAKRVLITTHVRPDGDALGTSAAMVLGLRQRKIEAEVLLLSRLPDKYAFIFSDAGIVHHDADAGWPASLALDRFDMFLAVDTGTWSQLPGLKERFANWPVPKLVLDHHLTQENWADAKLVATDAAAASEIAAALLDAWGVSFEPALASALFLGIATDTGWFQFSNTRPYTLRLAARLLEAGVDNDRMYQLIYQNECAQRVALQTRALQSLELLLGNRLAVMKIAKHDFVETGADVADTENFINFPLQVRTVEVSLLLHEPIVPGPIRVSLRSKGQVDVSRFAEHFGGGGHARAAGLRMEGTLDEARNRLVAAMTKAMNAK